MTLHPTSPEVDAYIEAQPEPSRSRLSTLRAVLREELPQASEKMSYGMPTWHQRRNLVHIAGWERHIGLYPGPKVIEAFSEELTGFHTSKGAIQVPHEQELPLDLVRRIARGCVAEVADGQQAGLRDPGPLTFEATLLSSASSGAACFVELPWDLKATYGRGNLVPVHATWDGRVTYRGSLAMMGGERAILICRKDKLAELGKRAGDTVNVTVRLDRAPREVEVPEVLDQALDATAGARAAWSALSPSCQREYASWIGEAKKPETRAARLEKAIPMILARRRLKG